MADDYAVYGTWKLENFPEAVATWQQDERPPFRLLTDVNAWWPRLEHASEWVRAELVEEGDNLYVMWASKCYLLGSEGLSGLLCFFRLVAAGHRLVCDELHLSPGRRPPAGFGE